jgi:hypothetical protein
MVPPDHVKSVETSKFPTPVSVPPLITALVVLALVDRLAVPPLTMIVPVIENRVGANVVAPPATSTVPAPEIDAGALML